MEGPFRRSAPPLGPGSVVRPRLLRALVRRFEVPVICIEAGAGFGKSTLLAQAHHENLLAPRGRDAWLTCERGDASASALLAGLVTTLGGSVGGEVDVHAVAEQIRSASPVAVALLVDDVHLVEPGSGAEAALGALVQELPANGHLVLAGRRLPDLPLARLAAQQRVLRLSEDDLRFTDDELDEYARGADVEVVQLEPAAGWPALVALRASADDTRAFMLEEVVGGLDPEVRRTLAVAALIGGGDQAVLSAASGGSVDLALVTQIPLVACTADGRVHVHGLWSELLTDELTEAEQDDARRAAADLLAQRGAHGEAFELLVASRLWREARRELLEACNDQAHPPWPEQLRRWERMLPDDEIGAGPRAYIDALVARADAAWTTTAHDHFRDAIAAFAADGDLVNEVRAMVRAAYAAWQRADLETIDAFGDRIVELSDRLPGAPFFWALNRAGRADLDGNWDLVLETLDGLGTAGVEPRVAYFPACFRVDALLSCGKAGAALEAAQEAAALADGLVPAAGAHSAKLRLPVTRWAAGERAALTDPLLTRDPGPAVARDERAEGLAWGVIAATYRGDLSTARTLQRVLEAITELELPARLHGLVALARTAYAVGSGDEPVARAELLGVLDPGHPSPATSWRAVLWQPAVAACLDAGVAAALEQLVPGPRGRAILDAATRVRALRAGEPAPPAGPLLDDPDDVMTAFPLTYGVELAVGALVDRDERGHRVIEAYVETSPTATRASLQRLAEGPGPTAAAARGVLGVLPIPPEQPVRIEVLGAAQLRRGDAVIDDADWRRERVRALLLLLVVRSDVRREEAASLLWPDLDQHKSAANLRLTLHYLQAVLEPHRARREAPYFVSQDAGFLRLRGRDRLSVDAWELTALFDEADDAEASGAPSRALDLLLEATSLWRGEPFEDVAFAEWAAPTRDWLHARYVAGAVRAAELLLAGDRPRDALELAERVLEVEPWSEPALRVRVSAHLACGHRAAALRALEACRATLAELGVEPDAETRMVANRVTEAR
ncbi:MAG TPA: BTAD domain-containing putative transcriptional regulator [Acidimicrobiia bacterium]